MVSPTYLNAELEGDEDEDQIKIAYRRLAKYYHPDGLPINLFMVFILLLLFFSLIIFIESVLTIVSSIQLNL